MVVTDPEAVESHIIAQSRKHFQQAQGTPFTLEPLNLLQSDQEADAQRILLSGLPDGWQNVPPAGWNTKTIALIERLIQAQHIPVIDSTIDLAEFKKGIKKWKERTVTSPSGRHLGHLHSLLAPDGIQELDEEESTVPLAETILILHLDMLNLAIQWGYAPERWRNVVIFVL